MEDVNGRRRFGLESFQGRTFDEPVERFQGEDLPARGQEHLPHVFAANAKTSASDARNHFILGLVSNSASHAEFSQVLDARHLVASSAIVFSDLRLNDDLRIEFVRNDEIRRLVKARDPFRPLCLSEADAVYRRNYTMIASTET